MNSEDVYRTQFATPQAGNRGYQVDEVDAFLDVIAARLKLRNHLTADEVHKIAFRRAPVDQGYDTEQVDHFLNRVEGVLAGTRHKALRESRNGSGSDHSFDPHGGKRNRAAVVSLWGSILGFTGVGLVVAVVSGAVALLRTRRTHQRGRAFVFAALLISAAWVALALVWLHLSHPTPIRLEWYR